MTDEPKHNYAAKITNPVDQRDVNELARLQAVVAGLTKRVASLEELVREMVE